MGLGADFRSDTLTQPTAAMRAAMAAATVGDDVFGEDPTVQALEREAAQALGMEQALFVPSGTMANQIAVHVHCRSGDELICEERSHVFVYEGGGAARLSGTQVRTCATRDGFPTPEQVAGLIRVDNDHYPRSRLLVLENTHNMAGGRVLRPDRQEALVAVARQHGLAVHVDGARLANAAVALQLPLPALTRGIDSVSLCFSKGLGAPVGSVIAGTAAFVKAARRARKAFGGGMRQAGILAAAARIALSEGMALLARDHARAQRLARAFAALDGLVVAPETVETNIVIVEVPGRAPDELVTYLASRGVRALVVGPGRVRFVLHRDLSDAGVELCVHEVATWTRNPKRTP